MRVAAAAIVIACLVAGGAAQGAAPVRVTGWGKITVRSMDACQPPAQGAFRIRTVGKTGLITYSDSCKPARFRATALTTLWYDDLRDSRHVRFVGKGIFNGRKVDFAVSTADIDGGPDAFNLLVSTNRNAYLYEARGRPPAGAIVIR